MIAIKNEPSIVIRGIFWLWSFLFYVITYKEIDLLISESFGERKIMMVAITAFLLLVYIILYLCIMMDNIIKKYFSRLEFLLFMGGLIISVLFIFALRHNATLPIRYQHLYDYHVSKKLKNMRKRTSVLQKQRLSYLSDLRSGA